MVAQAALLDPGIDLDELGLHELDPDDDVGLYDEEEDGLMDEEYMGDFIGDEDGDFVLPDEWDDQLGDLIHEDDYHANLHEFQVNILTQHKCSLIACWSLSTIFFWIAGCRHCERQARNAHDLCCILSALPVHDAVFACTGKYHHR